MKKEPQKKSMKELGFYHSREWRRLRVMALQRDHYLCQACLRKKRIQTATEVHHLKPVEDFPELALALDNLESLCWDCHEETKTRARKEIKLPQGVRVINISGESESE